MCRGSIGTAVTRLVLGEPISTEEGIHEDEKNLEHVPNGSETIAPEPVSFGVGTRQLSWLSQQTVHGYGCKNTTSFELLRRASCVTSDADSDLAPLCLQSFEADEPKKTGGDEMYVQVVWASEKTIVAVGWVHDLINGAYTVKFDFFPGKSRKDGRSIIINLQYSCRVGLLGPPSKRDWFWDGFPGLKIVLPLKNDIRLPLRSSSPERVQLNISKYDKTVAVGDSLVEQLVQGGELLGSKKNLLFLKLQAALTTDTVEPIFLKKIRAGLTLAKSQGHKQLAYCFFRSLGFVELMDVARVRRVWELSSGT